MSTSKVIVALSTLSIAGTGTYLAYDFLSNKTHSTIELSSEAKKTEKNKQSVPSADETDLKPKEPQGEAGGPGLVE